MSKERPSQAAREAVADDINEGGPFATEVVLEEVGLGNMGGEGKVDILEEAAAERAEGGGPIADAVDALDRRQNEEQLADND